jgi:hypothetical protein
MSGQVTALYHNLYDAGRAIEDLVASGVGPDEISLVTSEARAPILEIEYGEPERDAAAGSGAIGGALRAIGGSLTASGNSGIIATGPLLSALADGDRALAESLRTAGLPKRGARLYADEIRRHDALMVGVRSGRHASGTVRGILERHHASAVTEPA